VLECVVNISEGRDQEVLAALRRAAGADLLDVHTDPDHNRSVFTTMGEAAPRALATTAIDAIDLREHEGVHPRLGVVDVVPFVALDGSSDADALVARDGFARWLSVEHKVPSFLYGPERTLPEVRRDAFRGMEPDAGPSAPHPTAGASAVGARPVLIAYNVWLGSPDIELARRVATDARRPGLRALGLAVGARVQVSMNLTTPDVLNPADAYDIVDDLLRRGGGAAAGGELVGLLPRAVLRQVNSRRWSELDLSDARTIESRLETALG
jgi:glutamate formiminotransferase / 5-formyltetrahydrofolate cyclo-ligase